MAARSSNLNCTPIEVDFCCHRRWCCQDKLRCCPSLNSPPRQRSKNPMLEDALNATRARPTVGSAVQLMPLSSTDTQLAAKGAQDRIPCGSIGARRQGGELRARRRLVLPESAIHPHAVYCIDPITAHGRSRAARCTPAEAPMIRLFETTPSVPPPFMSTQKNVKLSVTRR
eukprot:SAG22_NODE_16_length_32723_cov_26.404825_16_plen_171_part_00